MHKEIIYQKAIAIELSESEIPFVEEKSIDVKYKGKKIGVYKPDFIIDDKVILEIKVAPFITKAMKDQVFYYVKGTKYKLVLLANFGTSKVGIKRLTNKTISKTTSLNDFCHCGLSAILLSERFPTSGNDIQRDLTYELLSIYTDNKDGHRYL